MVAVDDLLLEDDREMFSISISLDDSGVLAEIESDKSLVEITILDNEGKRIYELICSSIDFCVPCI